MSLWQYCHCCGFGVVDNHTHFEHDNTVYNKYIFLKIHVKVQSNVSYHETACVNSATHDRM